MGEAGKEAGKEGGREGGREGGSPWRVGKTTRGLASLPFPFDFCRSHLYPPATPPPARVSGCQSLLGSSPLLSRGPRTRPPLAFLPALPPALPPALLPGLGPWRRAGVLGTRGWPIEGLCGEKEEETCHICVHKRRGSLNAGQMTREVQCAEKPASNFGPSHILSTPRASHTRTDFIGPHPLFPQTCLSIAPVSFPPPSYLAVAEWLPPPPSRAPAGPKGRDSGHPSPAMPAEYTRLYDSMVQCAAWHVCGSLPRRRGSLPSCPSSRDAWWPIFKISSKR